MSSVKFFLFGKFCIEVDRNTTCKVESRKAEELLGFLLLNKDQPHSRERLADMLWGEISQEQASNYMRKTLWQLQSTLESLDLHGQELIRVNGEYLQINPSSEIWLDVSIFEDSFKQTQGILGRDMQETQAQMLMQVIEFYRGDLLEGWYQSWCLYDRERLQHLYLAMLDKLMDYCETHGSFENGLEYGEKILKYDRARERTHRRLMRLYYLAGDRTSALRQYRKCKEVLKAELEVEPANSTRLVYEQICADSLGSVVAPDKVRIHKSDKDPLLAVFSHLSTLHKELSQMQKQVMQDMRAIQRTLKED